LFARGVGLPDCRRVLVLFLEDIRLRSARSLSRVVRQPQYRSEPVVSRIVSLHFHRANFKSALIELCFDLGAPFW